MLPVGKQGHSDKKHGIWRQKTWLSALLLPLALYVIMERLSLQLPCEFVMSFKEDNSHVFEQWRREIFSSP